MRYSTGHCAHHCQRNDQTHQYDHLIQPPQPAQQSLGESMVFVGPEQTGDFEAQEQDDPVSEKSNQNRYQTADRAVLTDEFHHFAARTVRPAEDH